MSSVSCKEFRALLERALNPRHMESRWLTERRGEIGALVYATGQNTYFGKTAQLVQEAHTVSHFQRAVLKIGDYLILLAVALVALILAGVLFRFNWIDWHQGTRAPTPDRSALALGLLWPSGPRVWPDRTKRNLKRS